MVRTFITCDVCNKEGLMARETRGRGVYMESRRSALEIGWRVLRDGSGEEKHVCIECQDDGEHAAR
jgi:hypothetical protein